MAFICVHCGAAWSPAHTCDPQRYLPQVTPAPPSWHIVAQEQRQAERLVVREASRRAALGCGAGD